MKLMQNIGNLCIGPYSWNRNQFKLMSWISHKIQVQFLGQSRLMLFFPVSVLLGEQDPTEILHYMAPGPTNNLGP